MLLYFAGQQKTSNAFIHAGLWTSLDFIELSDGARKRTRTSTPEGTWT